MAEIAFITILGEILLPLDLLIWSWPGICGSRVEWLLKNASLACLPSFNCRGGHLAAGALVSAYGFAAPGTSRRPGGLGELARPFRIMNAGSGPVFGSDAILTLAVFCAECFSGRYADMQHRRVRHEPGITPEEWNVLCGHGGYSILIQPPHENLGCREIWQISGAELCP